MPRNAIHELSDGRKTYAATDVDGKRHKLVQRKNEPVGAFKDRCDALDAMCRGTVTVQRFDDLFQMWQANHLIPNCSKGDADTSKRLYAAYIKPLIGRRALSDIKRIDVYNILTQAQSAGLARGTLIKIRGCVSRPYNWAINTLGMTLTAPTTGLRFAYQDKSNVKRRRSLTPKDTDRLLEAAKTSTYEPCIRLMLLTGLRPSEALGLQARDIKANHVEIRRGVTLYGQTELKTSQARRDIPLNDQTRRLLSALKRDKAFRTREGWLFPSESGQPSMNALTLAMSRICRQTAEYERGGRNGMKKLRLIQRPVKATLYDLRHTFATRMAEKGMPHATLKMIMGHKDIQTTLSYYVDVTENMLDQAREMMVL